MRGKHEIAREIPEKMRITPACAGKTAATCVPFDGAQDHPRVCGENTGVFGDKSISAGSPPRVRGKQAVEVMFVKAVGITPACAGKTARTMPPKQPSQDHPRVCGENGFLKKITNETEGSPPRVRGKLRAFWMGVLVCGITPACAGKTKREAARGERIQDHPRVCGENLLPQPENSVF